MTPEQISYCELLFTMIDREILPRHYTSQMFHQTCTFQMQVYVEWLLNRWVVLRTNINHYPQKINNQKVVKKVRFNSNIKYY